MTSPTLNSKDIEAAGGMPRLVPVSVSRFPLLSDGVASNAVMSRSQYYFPKGGQRVQLYFAGAYAGATETNFGSAVPSMMSCAIAPAPWDPAVQYQPGDKVVYYPTAGGGGSYANNPYFICAVANINSPPKPGNTNWAAGSRPTPVPITFEGSRDGTLPTITLPDGTTITKGGIWSDPLPLSVPVGGYLELWTWINASVGLYPAPRPQPMRMGLLRQRGAAQADLTLSMASLPSPSDIGGSRFEPLIFGSPLANTRSCALIGDSISEGAQGTVGIVNMSIVDGGGGNVVGDIFALPDTGATAGAVSAGSQALFIVSAVSAGAVTSLLRLDPGSYTGTGTQTGQTLPTGDQALIPVTGSGSCTVTVAFGGSVNDTGNQYGAIGFGERGILAAGLPCVSFAAGGDRAKLWAARSYSRFSAIGAATPTDLIIALGRNDIDAGDSAATILTNLQLIASKAKALGVKRVHVCTVTPATQSTTAAGQSTYADQTVGATNATVREPLNTLLRAVPTGFDGCIDIAAAVEGSGSNAGKWAPIGGLPAAADGKHPGPAARNLMAEVVRSYLAALA